MLKSWIKKQVGEVLEDILNPPSKLESRAVERAMEGSAPAVIAFRIKNGFLLRNNVIPPNGIIGSPQTEFVYCADAQALGDAIVSAHVRDRMQESSRPRSMETAGYAQEAAMPTGPAVNRI